MQQLTLFDIPSTLPIEYHPGFLQITEAEALYTHCKALQWQQNEIRMSGKPLLPHYSDEEFHGAEGVVAQHSSIDRCIVRFGDETSKLIPDNMLVVLEIREVTSVKQENQETARSLGLKPGLQVLPDIERNEGVMSEAQQEEIERAIASFLRLLPRFSQQQKGLVYEQLMKSGLKVGVAA